MSEEIKIPLQFSQISITTADGEFLSSYMDVQRVYLNADICDKVFSALSKGAEIFITIRPEASGEGENNNHLAIVLKN